MNDKWLVSRLHAVADVRVSNVDKKFHTTETPVKLCNYMDVYTNDYVTAAIEFMTASASKAEIERFGLLPGDVVITKDSETPDDIGVSAVISEQISGLVCGYHLALIRPRQDAIDPIYLAKQLRSWPSIKYFAASATGSTRFGLSISTIEDLEIPLAPRPEQTTIAQILLTVDRAIEQTEASLAKQRRVKTGLMQDILTHGIDEHGTVRSERTHEFKGSPLGRVPAEWDVIALGSSGRWTSGGTPSKGISRFWGGDIPWVCPKDMKTFELANSIDRITDEGAQCGSRLMPKGTVFIVIRGMILAHTFPVGYATRPMAFNQDVKAVVARPGLSSRYLAYWLVAHAHAILKIATTATHGTKRFDMDDLFAVSVAVPKPEEQELITNAFDGWEHQIDLMRAHLSKLRSLKTGLMHDLLSGDRRVTSLLVEPEAAAT